MKGALQIDLFMHVLCPMYLQAACQLSPRAKKKSAQFPKRITINNLACFPDALSTSRRQMFIAQGDYLFGYALAFEIIDYIDNLLFIKKL